LVVDGGAVVEDGVAVGAVLVLHHCQVGVQQVLLHPNVLFRLFVQAAQFLLEQVDPSQVKIQQFVLVKLHLERV
jgi:hypothetical protein